MSPTATQSQIAQSATLFISRKEIKQACKAQTEAAAAGRVKDAADNKKKAASMLVFERLLGIMTEDRLRGLSPEKMKRLARRRIRAGLVQLDGISAEDLMGKVIQKSKSERRPSWKDCFTAVLGVSAATKVQESTPETFSYKFVEAGL
jgi:hypothetical protein